MWEILERCPVDRKSIQALSSQKIQELTISQEYPQWVILPKFWSYEDFIKSDFFQKYYFLWDDIISFSPDSHFLQMASLDPQAQYIEKLQRMLVILWYIDVEIFSGNYCDIDPESESCSEISPWRYFWVYGKKTQRALTQFQNDKAINEKKISEVTQKTLYRDVYYYFHSMQKDICKQETQQKLYRIKSHQK